MTAKSVNGLAVIADDATELMVAGRVLRSEMVRTLLLEDESVVYGCVKCDYTSPIPGSIPPHTKVHGSKKPKPRNRPAQKPQEGPWSVDARLTDDSLAELRDRLERLEAHATTRESRQAATEPGRQVGFFHTGMGTWVVIAWKEHNPKMLQVYGFFPNQTAAKKWGAKYFPRHYHVGNVATTTDRSVPRGGR